MGRWSRVFRACGHPCCCRPGHARPGVKVVQAVHVQLHLSRERPLHRWYVSVAVVVACFKCISTGDEVFLKIAIVADLDKDSKHEKGYWQSYLLEGLPVAKLLRHIHTCHRHVGHLIRHVSGTYRVEWEKEPILLQSYFSEKGRGLELSELQVFNGLSSA